MSSISLTLSNGQILQRYNRITREACIVKKGEESLIYEYVTGKKEITVS